MFIYNYYIECDIVTKKRLRKECDKCRIKMYRSYIQHRIKDKNAWKPIGWYCVVCDKFVSDKISPEIDTEALFD